MMRSQGDLDERIRRALEPIAGIAVAVLFGSRARGDERPASDLDIGLVPSSRDAAGRRRLRNRAAAELADLAPDGRVDVVLLDDAPVLLRQRVMEHGRVVLCNDLAKWQQLRVATMREWGDFEPFLRRYAEAQRQRLSEGRIGGRRPRAVESLERTGRLSG